MYAAGQSFTDYNRLANSNFLLELSYWLENLPEEGGIEVNTGNEVKQAVFLKATAANAMSMGLMGETIDQGVMYQIQIQAQYKVIESEEI